MSKILIIEDDREIAEIERDYLELDGFASDIASDGVSELLEDKINAMDEESYAQYLRYHFYICEKPEMLGMSNHLLFIGKN